MRSASQAQPEDGDRVQVDREALRQALASAGKNQYADALNRVESVLNSPAFLQLRSEERHTALYVAGVAAYNLKQFTKPLFFWCGQLRRQKRMQTIGMGRLQASYAAAIMAMLFVV